MTFPAGETFAADPTITPCQLHFPANSSPRCERGLAGDRLWWQTTAACGGSVQHRHSSSKGHHSQSGHTVSKRGWVNWWAMIRRAQFQWESTGRDESIRASWGKTPGQTLTDIKKESEQANYASSNRLLTW